MLRGQDESFALFLLDHLEKFAREAVLDLFAKFTLGLASTQGAGDGPAEPASVFAIIHTIIVIGLGRLAYS